MKLYHAQVKFYYADTMLTRADHATYHVWNVAMEWLPTIEIEVCSSFEPETELGVATSATAPSLLDRLRCPARSELSRKTQFSGFYLNFLLPKCSIIIMLDAFGFYYAQNYAGIIRT